MKVIDYCDCSSSTLASRVVRAEMFFFFLNRSGFPLFLPVSLNSREDRNLASFGLSGDDHENTETNLLLARAGEDRILPIFVFYFQII